MWSEVYGENLLREWHNGCRRGGRGWSGGGVETVHPNDQAWNDPATFKLFQDLRAVGWGVVNLRHDIFKCAIRVIRPRDKRHRDMDRPEPISDHADLGTREPNDPELRGYDPGHPWFYLLGGRPLRPEEIEPDKEWELPHDVKLDRMKDPAKRQRRLMEMQKEHEQALQRDIDRYLEVITPGYADEGDRLETSIYLCHNHIWANKAWLAAINRELTKYQAPPSPPPKKVIPVWEPDLKPIPQPKEQLTLF